MTLKEAIEKACIIGEFERDDYSKEEYAALADQAQKILASLGMQITEHVIVEKGVAVYTLPYGCTEVQRVKSRLSEQPVQYEVIGNEIYLDGSSDADIFYARVPSDITAATSESYIFEIVPQAHFAVPYYMVYHLCKTNDVENAQAALTEWNKYAALLKKKQPAVVKRIAGRYGEEL